MDGLLIYGCNAGHLDYEHDNVAYEGWSDDEEGQFKDVANDIGVGLRFIKNKDQLIDYINNKNNKTRHLDRITSFVVFSHGLANNNGTISLGYNYNSNYNKDLNIDKDDINNSIYATAFSNPTSIFYSCNIGTSKENSFAQAWVNKFGGTTKAFSGKSSFENINGSAIAHPLIWFSRKLHGFSYYGSANYPEASEGAEFITFCPKN